MTQPVQEPNAQRDLSGLGWGERQLARRPAPPTAAGAAIAYARFERQSTSDITVLDQNNTLITGTTHSTSDASIVDADNSNIYIVTAGLYAIQAQIAWSSYDDHFRSTWVWVNGDHHVVQGGSADAFDDFPMVSGVRRLAALDTLTLAAHQSSGGSMTVYGGGSGNPDGWDTCWLEASYLGPV